MKFLKKKKELLNLNLVKVFLNTSVKCGLKGKSFLNFLKLLKNLKLKFKKDPKLLIFKGFDRLRILVYIYKKKVGSKVVLIPVYRNSVKKVRKGFLLFYKNLVRRNELFFDVRLVKEFFDVLGNKGRTINARNNLYLAAKNNRYNLKYAIKYKLEKEEQKQKKKKEKVMLTKGVKTISFKEDAYYYTKIRTNNFDLIHNYYGK